MGADLTVVNDAELREAGSNYEPLVRLWMLRLLARTGAGARYARRGLDNDDVAYFLGYEPSGKGNRVREFVDWCRAELARVEGVPPTPQGVLFENVQTLGKLLVLSPVEAQLLAFKVLAVANGELSDVLHKGFGPISDHPLPRIMATALGCDPGEVEVAVRPEASLISSSVVMVQPAVLPFNVKLAVPAGLVSSLLSRHGSVDSLIGFATRRTAPAALQRTDFPHLAAQADMLCRFLAAVRHDGLAGVNILLHGPPGMGKTEFVKALATEMDLRLYEVNMTSREGEALSPQGRMDAYCLNQRLFSRDQDVLVLFDEIEDVFPPPGAGPERKAIDKAWLNRLLETNPVPAFWLSNRIRHIDPAHLRRFDYVFEMTAPPRSVRRRILADELNGLPVSDGALERQANRAHFTPALAERVGRVLRRLDLRDERDVERHLDALVASHLEAQGHNATAIYPVVENYRLDLLNTNVNLEGLAERLRDGQRVALLLHGPPGTGKTAYAHVLARQLDRPLLVRRASELQSMWVGETEKNLARMFRDAEAERSVLLLDEADSFLQDRREAVRTWEVSQVNELLTQMDNFGGIFVCATNFLERLDPASIRRFGLKIGFRYLTPDQRLGMLEEILRAMGAGELKGTERETASRALGSLHNLTPGDFAAVRERVRLSVGAEGIEGVLTALREESGLKPNDARAFLGFVPG